MATKNYLQISLLLISFGLLTSCSKSNDWNTLGLNGKVKTCIERYYDPEMKFGEWVKGEIEYSGHNRMSFDSKGNIQGLEYLADDNALETKVIYTRENGDIIEEAFYDEDGELFMKVKLLHISKNELEFIEYDKDGEKLTQGKSYYANNRVVKREVQAFKDNKVNEEYAFAFEYDKDGNLVSRKETIITEEKTYLWKYEYLAFDEKKNWTKVLIYDSREVEGPVNIVIREYEYY